MARILVTGSTGLLGCTLVPWLQSRGHVVLRHGFAADADFRADLREFAPTAAMLDLCQPQCIIHLAALTDVDACESNPHQAYLLNVASVAHLCRWISVYPSHCHLVQISTDQVYDGTGPHAEAAVTIRNLYALSKIAAEAVAEGVSSTVLRTNFFGRSRCPGRRSFSDWVYESLRRGQPLSLFDDVLFSPLSLATLCDMVERVVCLEPRGVFNLGAGDGSSKADFAYAFAQMLELPTTGMQRVHSSSSALLKAYRPKDMRMDSGLIERTLGLRMPTLRDEILATRADYLEAV